jgi:hypothetical protein
LSGLPGEETIYVGARGRDDAGLVGELATAQVLTIPVPPSPVTIESTNQTDQSLSVQFSASGDDALSGDADGYIITFNQGVVDLATNTSADWEWQLQANAIDDTSMIATLDTNLMPDGRYAIQIIAVDDAGHRSFPSNAVMIQIGAEEDLTAPACLVGLEGVLASESGALAPISKIELSPDGETYTSLGSSDTLTLTDQDPGTVYSYAQETEALWMRLTLANKTRLDKAVLDHIPGFEAYLATVQSATCDESNGPAELQALEPTLTESGVELIPRTQGLKCTTLTLQLALPRLADYNVLGLADLQVMRAPYPSGTVTLSWVGTGDDDLEGVASTQAVYATCEGQNRTHLDALVLGPPSGPFAPERVVIPGDYLNNSVPCDTITELAVATCDEAANCVESALQVNWEASTIMEIDTLTCTAP